MSEVKGVPEPTSRQGSESLASPHVPPPDATQRPPGLDASTLEKILKELTYAGITAEQSEREAAIIERFVAEHGGPSQEAGPYNTWNKKREQVIYEELLDPVEYTDFPEGCVFPDSEMAKKTLERFTAQALQDENTRAKILTPTLEPQDFYSGEATWNRYKKVFDDFGEAIKGKTPEQLVQIADDIIEGRMVVDPSVQGRIIAGAFYHMGQGKTDLENPFRFIRLFCGTSYDSKSGVKTFGFHFGNVKRALDDMANNPSKLSSIAIVDPAEVSRDIFEGIAEISFPDGEPWEEVQIFPRPGTIHEDGRRLEGRRQEFKASLNIRKVPKDPAVLEDLAAHVGERKTLRLPPAA